MLARVSSLETFRRWRNWQPLHDDDVEPTVEDLVQRLTVSEPTAAMLAGTALHAALEVVEPGEYETFAANGHTFQMTGGVLALPAIREMRAYGRYGDLTVTGQVDALNGLVVIDHKTTKRFDAEGYLGGYQWRFYLDLFGANVFQWNVFEIKDQGDDLYSVGEPQILCAYRYPGMRADCEALAADYLDFAREHMPGQPVRLAA